mgnify:CR=1 FL=1
MLNLSLFHLLAPLKTFAPKNAMTPVVDFRVQTLKEIAIRCFWNGAVTSWQWLGPFLPIQKPSYFFSVPLPRNIASFCQPDGCKIISSDGVEELEEERESSTFGQAHHMFSQFLNLRKKNLNFFFSLVSLKVS